MVVDGQHTTSGLSTTGPNTTGPNTTGPNTTETVHPDFPGSATVGEMLRVWWPFTAGGRLHLAIALPLSLALFALSALVPLLTGRLIDAALASSSAEERTKSYLTDWLAIQRAGAQAVVGAPEGSDQNSVRVGVRSATVLALAAGADGLVDALFPDGFSYVIPERLRADVALQLGEPDAPYEAAVRDVLSDGVVSRQEIDALRDDGASIVGAEAFDYVIGVLSLDAGLSEQRTSHRRSLLLREIAVFVVVLVSIVGLRIFAVGAALRFTLHGSLALRDEVFGRIHDTALVDSGALGRPSMVSRATSYVDTVSTALLAGQLRGVPAVASIVLSSALVVWIDAQIGLVMIGIVVAFELVRRSVSGRWSRLSHERLDRNTVLSEITDDAVMNRDGARAAGIERWQRDRFGRQAARVSRDSARLETFAEGFGSFAFGLAQLGVVGVVAVIGFARDDLSLVTATAAVLYVRALGEAIANIPSVVIELQEAAPYMRRIRRVLASPERRPVEVEAGAANFAQLEPAATTDVEVQLEDADGRALDGSPGVARADFTVRRDRWCVAVGGPAAARRSLFGLVGGFELPVRGDVSLGGCSTRTLDLADVRRSVICLPSDPVVLEATLLANVTLESDERAVDLERVGDVIEAVGLGGLVATLPEGITSRLGGRARQLDRVDRTRLGVARVLYGLQPVVVIDDPTTGLDRDVADDLWRVLRANTAERAVFVVTPRPEVVHEGDHVVVLRRGTQCESGQRHDLLAAGGAFAALFASGTGLGEGVELASLPALENLDERVLEMLGGRLVTERYDEGERIFVQGDPADRVFFIVDGSVELDDGTRRLAMVGSGDHFGDIDLADEGRRSFGAVARTPVVVRSLHRLAISGGVAGLLDRSPAERAVYRELARRGEMSIDALAGLIGSTSIDDAVRALCARGDIVESSLAGERRFKLSPSRRRSVSGRTSRVLDVLDG